MKLGNYEVRGEIARGGMGVVYRAWDPSLGREVAIKLLHGRAQPTPRQRARFQREAEALARLRHPHVVQVHAVGTHDGAPYLVLDLIKGRSLEERLREGPLPPREAAQMVVRLAFALEHAHTQGVLHRDVKPDNVLLRENDEPLLTDFGLAALEEDEGLKLTRSGASLGTPGYWAPEQAMGRSLEIGPPTDVYGLGTVLFACLTGRAPFASEGVEALVAACDQPAPSPGADHALDAICLRCLQKEPAARYPSMAELARDLERYLGRGLAPRRSRRGRLALAAGALLALAALAYVARSTAAKPGPSSSLSPPPSSPSRPPASTSPADPPSATHASPTPAESTTRAATLLHPAGGPLEVRGTFLSEELAVTWAMQLAEPQAGRIQLWDLSQPQRPQPGRSWVTRGPVTGLVALPEGGFLAVQRVGPAQQLVRVASQEAELEVLVAEGAGWQLALSADARWALSYRNPNDTHDAPGSLAITLRQAATGALEGELVLPEPREELRQITTTPAGLLVSVGNGPGRLRVWDLAQQRLLHTADGLLNLRSAVTRPGSEEVWVGDAAGMVCRVDPHARPPSDWQSLNSPDLLETASGGLANEFTRSQAHLGTVQDLAFSPTGHRLFSVAGNTAGSLLGLGGDLRGWNPDQRSLSGAITDVPAQPCAIDVSPSGRWLLVAMREVDPRVELWPAAALEHGPRSYAEATSGD